MWRMWAREATDFFLAAGLVDIQSSMTNQNNRNFNFEQLILSHPFLVVSYRSGQSLILHLLTQISVLLTAQDDADHRAPNSIR